MGPETGQTVVMVHGFTTPYFVWDYNVNKLINAGFRVFRYDHYGRGFSDRPDVAYDRDLYDQLLIELLQKLNIKTPVHLVGLSMGGAICVVFADRHPGMVSSVSLIAPAGFPIEEPLQLSWHRHLLSAITSWLCLRSSCSERCKKSICSP